MPRLNLPGSFYAKQKRIVFVYLHLYSVVLISNRWYRFLGVVKRLLRRSCRLSQSRLTCYPYMRFVTQYKVIYTIMAEGARVAQSLGRAIKRPRGQHGRLSAPVNSLSLLKASSIVTSSFCQTSRRATKKSGNSSRWTSKFLGFHQCVGKVYP